MNPIVIAYHLVWTAYGWWLPNDPRGSGSSTIRSDVLAELGAVHFGRKKIQPPGKVIGAFYKNATDLLKHPLLTFDEIEIAYIAQAFAQVISEQSYTCYGCAIMPDHVHVLIRKHKHSAEDIASNLMESSRQRLIDGGKRAMTHPVWIAGNGWKVFLDHPDEIRRTIKYINNNPLKDGLPAQKWPFVIEYNGWPLHPGHSPNSPYAKRLRAIGRYP
jgi:REP element-mobilizing transposase RayT